MTLRKYLIIMSIMTIISWIIFVYVLLSINPEITNWLGFMLFYISLFLSIIGTSALVGFLVRFVFLKKHMAFRLVKEAFRQSFLFAFLIVISLILLSQNLFTWLNIFFLIISLSLLEFFMLSYEK